MHVCDEALVMGFWDREDGVLEQGEAGKKGEVISTWERQCDACFGFGFLISCDGLGRAAPLVAW